MRFTITPNNQPWDLNRIIFIRYCNVKAILFGPEKIKLTITQLQTRQILRLSVLTITLNHPVKLNRHSLTVR